MKYPEKTARKVHEGHVLTEDEKKELCEHMGEHSNKGIYMCSTDGECPYGMNIRPPHKIGDVSKRYCSVHLILAELNKEVVR